MRSLWNGRLMVVLALLSLLAALGARPALAAGVVGNGTAGSCTESALDSALLNGGSVTFNCGPNPVTITLTGFKTIMNNTTINGGGKITLSASSTYHFQVAAFKTLTLQKIKLTNGYSGSAGAIENFGTTKLIQATLDGNQSTGGGGAVRNYGTLIVKKSTFSNNKGDKGGAIYNIGDSVSVKKSKFQYNQATSDSDGGAIYNQNGVLNVSSSTFSNNTAFNGGAIQNEATASIKGSKFNDNTASNGGGAIMNLNHSMTIDTTTVNNNLALYGGGVVSYGTTFNVSRSTFSGNKTTSDGGGLYISGAGYLTNVTVSGNQVGSGHGGGGIYQNNGNTRLIFVTIANNQGGGYGGGVYKDGTGTGSMRLQNTVLSNNTSGNCAGVITTDGHNLSSDTYCSAFTGPGDKQNKKAKLGPLANNGGPTLTHMPQAKSKLINKGVAAGGINIDQRSVARPQHLKYDIGAVEVQ